MFEFPCPAKNNFYLIMNEAKIYLEVMHGSMGEALLPVELLPERADQQNKAPVNCVNSN